MKTKIKPSRLVYLYCITNTKPVAQRNKEMGSEIYSIGVGSIRAIVEQVSSDEFSQENLKKKLSDIHWVEDKVRYHEQVIEEIMKHTAVLPFKFATIFESEGNVKKMLQAHTSEFKLVLKNLRNKEEWGVKLYCDVEKLKDCLMNEDAILNTEKQITSSTIGKAYFLKKKKESLLLDTIDNAITHYSRECFEKLKPFSIEAKINRLLPREVTERKEQMILNSAFLVDKKKLSDFIKTANTLKKYHNKKGISMYYTGPWPPYHFCNMPIKNR